MIEIERQEKLLRRFQKRYDQINIQTEKHQEQMLMTQNMLQ